MYPDPVYNTEEISSAPPSVDRWRITCT